MAHLMPLRVGAYIPLLTMLTFIPSDVDSKINRKVAVADAYLLFI